jgi:hypothetical protein
MPRSSAASGFSIASSGSQSLLPPPSPHLCASVQSLQPHSAVSSAPVKQHCPAVSDKTAACSACSPALPLYPLQERTNIPPSASSTGTPLPV